MQKTEWRGQGLDVLPTLALLTSVEVSHSEKFDQHFQIAMKKSRRAPVNRSSLLLDLAFNGRKGSLAE